MNNVVIDLSATKYCDSSGLSAILNGNRWCKDTNGTFVLAGLTPAVEKMVKIAQLDRVLNIVPTKEEAEDFYARHKYINNASQGKMSVLCRGDKTVGDYLPKGITVYKRYKEGKGFELEPIGSVVHYDRFAFDTTDVTYRVEGLMSLIHSTPAESYHGIRLVGPSRSISGELYMTNIKDPELAFKLKDLEDIAFAFGGVQKAYAIQAGRELRVIVESEKVDDQKAADLSFSISQKIQTDMTYPGQVKVTVIRETRAVNIAK